MNHLKSELGKLQSFFDIANAFADKYGDKLPEGLASISVFSTGATCSILTGWSEENRIKALALVGDVLGRTGWTQTLGYDRTHYNWDIVIDGIKVHIDRAEQVPAEREAQPVPPTKFPLQLEDVEQP